MEDNNLRFELPTENNSIIKVIGVGGGGSNAVDYMFEQGIQGVDFIVCNTDAQALDKSQVPIKIQLGSTLTKGQGAGSLPEVGKNAAVENLEDVKSLLNDNTTMVFITAGMGGGTGTGAAPIIAAAAKEMGILTVGIVTVPFFFEGRKRSNQAAGGLEEMRNAVDTLLVIKNDKLRELYGNLSLKKAFSHADEVLCTAAKGIAEVITLTGEINVDMNDVNTVMRNSGVAIMGSGTAAGEGRALTAVTEALESPLLNDNDITGANFVLLNITYGNDEVLMDEIMEITDHIQEQAGQSAEVIWGYGTDESLEDSLCVTIIATGFKAHEVDSGLAKPIVKKEIYDLGKDELKEVTGKISRPTQAPVEISQNEIKSESEGVDVSPTPNEEPYIKPEVIENNFQEVPLIEEQEEISSENKELLDDTNQEPALGDLFNTVETSDELNFELKKLDLEEETPSEVSDNLDTEQNTQETEPSVKKYILDEDSLDQQELPSLNTDAKEETKTSEAENELVFTNKTFSIEEDRPSRDVLMAKNKEREVTIRELTSKLKTPSGLTELEKEPAYKRRKIDLDDNPKASSDQELSRFSIGEKKDETGSGLSKNNPFLHDNVD